jgi:Tfp pilus assembly protein PilV
MLHPEEHAVVAAPNVAAAKGIILLEVILSLMLLSVAAGVAFNGLSSCFTALDRARMRSTAADLAVTKMSEIRLGRVELADSGPNDYDEDELAGWHVPDEMSAWTWQVTVTPLELTNLLIAGKEVQVEVAIRDSETGYVQRVSALMDAPAETEEGPDEQPAAEEMP